MFTHVAIEIYGYKLQVWQKIDSSEEVCLVNPAGINN